MLYKGEHRMNGKELIECALLKRPVSRLPCFPLIDTAFASAYAGKPVRELELNPEIHARALSLCAENLPVDGFYVNICLSDAQAKDIDAERGTLILDGALEVKIPEDDVMSVAKTDITDLSDERLFKAELFHPGMRETMRCIPERIKESFGACVGLSGTFTQGAFLLGVERFMMELIDNPDGVLAMLERRHETVLRQADELLEDGARFIWIGEGPASGSLISPEFYRAFVLPFEKSLTSHIRKRGGLSILHICGNTQALLSDIAKSGADGFDLDHPVDLAAAIAALSPAVAVKGNINPVLFLPGNERELESAVKKAIGLGEYTPGFIPSTGCLVPRDSSHEAFRIFARACRQ